MVYVRVGSRQTAEKSNNRCRMDKSHSSEEVATTVMACNRLLVDLYAHHLLGRIL